MKNIIMMLTVCLFAGQLMAQTSKTPPKPKPVGKSDATKPFAAPHAKLLGVSTKPKIKKETVKFTPPKL